MILIFGTVSIAIHPSLPSFFFFKRTGNGHGFRCEKTPKENPWAPWRFFHRSALQLQVPPKDFSHAAEAASLPLGGFDAGGTRHGFRASFPDFHTELHRNYGILKRYEKILETGTLQKT